MAGNRLRLKPYRYCKFCNSVVKSKELNRHEHSCLFKKAAAKASIIVMDGHCTFCKKIVRHTKDSPCKSEMVVGEGIERKQYVLSESMMEAYDLTKQILTALKPE
ncbi:hypothetical protein E3N88_31303 [Mikania micrantha]|uniref:Uncharacterized protein n=1 Tax=Mikania micrantha TaxID=192012 RepID=A0A5N6MPX9_9ASTR|nr:hypothetical protein E3N88_31303 [Mikania micrantha]